MTKNHFEQLHQECSKSLQEYMAAATGLCKLLGKYVDRQATLEELSHIAQQRSLENHLHGEYQRIRARLLNAAKVGYGELE